MPRSTGQVMVAVRSVPGTDTNGTWYGTDVVPVPTESGGGPVLLSPAEGTAAQIQMDECTKEPSAGGGRTR